MAVATSSCSGYSLGRRKVISTISSSSGVAAALNLKLATEPAGAPPAAASEPWLLLLCLLLLWKRLDETEEEGEGMLPVLARRGLAG